MRDRGRVARLTKRVVDTARPESSRYYVWDNELSGFALRVEPSGHKTFVARYRAGGGRSGPLRQTVLGRYGNITVEEGRTIAKRMLGAAAGGADPIGEKHLARQSGLTVSQLCDWYLEQAELGRLLGRKGRPIKASTLSMDRSRIERHVKPLIGKKAVSNLTLDDMENLQADITSGKTARPRGERGGLTVGGGSVAGRTLGMLHTILEHALRRGKITANPAKGVRRFADQKRNDRLSLEQIATLGEAMRKMENESRTGLSVIRLMLLTGFRRNEALGLKKEWLLDSGGVDFPDTKSGSQIRPVGRSAMELLKRQIRESGLETEWVFPADRGEGHFIGVRKVLNRVAKCAGVRCTPHLLRHTFSSIAGDLGYSELTIAGLLGHAAKGVTASYVHLDKVLVAAADHVSSFMAAQLDEGRQ